MTLRVFTVALALLFSMLISCSSDQAETDAGSSAADSKSPATTNQPSSIKPLGAPEAAVKGSIAFQAYDIDGTLRRSGEWIGRKPVIINIWGTWCPPCRREIPDMVKFYEEYRDKGLEIVGIAVRDTPDKVRNYADQQGMEWVMLVGDRQTVATMGNIASVPTTIVLDKEGNEVQRWVGPRSYEQFKAAADQVL